MTAAEPEGPKPPEWLTTGQVARMFAVDPKTVARWVKDGHLTRVIKTPGGTRRFDPSEVETLLRLPKT